MIALARSSHPRGVPFLAPPPSTLTAAQAGDAVALDAVARLCAPYVLRWCRRLGGPRVIADDAAQDVLVVVFQRIRAVRTPDDLGPWVFGVTRRVLADHRRRAWVLRWIPGLSPDRGAPARAELSCEASEVQELLERLPAAQREAFVLCAVEEHTDEEAAALLAVPVGTLKSRLRLARARLAGLHPWHEPAVARAWEDA